MHCKKVEGLCPPTQKVEGYGGPGGRTSLQWRHASLQWFSRITPLAVPPHSSSCHASLQSRMLTTLYHLVSALGKMKLPLVSLRVAVSCYCFAPKKGSRSWPQDLNGPTFQNTPLVRHTWHLWSQKSLDKLPDCWISLAMSFVLFISLCEYVTMCVQSHRSMCVWMPSTY